MPLEIEYRLTRDDWLALCRFHSQHTRQRAGWWNYPIIEGRGCGVLIGVLVACLGLNVWRLVKFHNPAPITEIWLSIAAIVALFIFAAVVIPVTGKRAMEQRWERQMLQTMADLERSGRVDLSGTTHVVVTPDAFTSTGLVRDVGGGVERETRDVWKVAWSALSELGATPTHVFLGVGHRGWLIVPRSALRDDVTFERFVGTVRGYWTARKPG